MTWPAKAAGEGAWAGLPSVADVSKEDRSLKRRRLGVPGRKLASFRTPVVAAWISAAFTCIEAVHLFTYQRDSQALKLAFVFGIRVIVPQNLLQRCLRRCASCEEGSARCRASRRPMCAIHFAGGIVPMKSRQSMTPLQRAAANASSCCEVHCITLTQMALQAGWQRMASCTRLQGMGMGVPPPGQGWQLGVWTGTGRPHQPHEARPWRFLKPKHRLCHSGCRSDLRSSSPPSACLLETQSSLPQMHYSMQIQQPGTVHDFGVCKLRDATTDQISGHCLLKGCGQAWPTK